MKGVTSTAASFSAFAVLGEAKINAAAEKRRLGFVAKDLPTDEIDGLIELCQLQMTNI